MAVHLKRPLPREPLSGKRHRRRVLALSALLAFGGFALLAPARAQEGSLGAGASAFTAGKYDATVRMMTGVLQADKVDPSEAAKALYYRGLAYQKLNQHTRAIADLGAAMWLGLPASERTAALVNRSLAYRATGLKAQADTELAAARKGDRGGDVDKIVASNGGGGAADTASISAFATEVRTEGGRTTTIASAAPEPAAAPPRNAEAANPGSWTTTQQSGGAPSEPPSGGNRLSRWWGSVRGSSSEPEPAPAPAPPPAPSAAAVTSAWTTQTQAEGGAPGTRVATASPTVPVPSGGGGNYLLQLSPTRSEAEASALWKTVAKQNAQLASLQPRIEKTDMGNLGTFYRLQIGPFPDKAESLKLCNALKRSGVDCFLVNP
jgi:cell division septation protein DedD